MKKVVKKKPLGSSAKVADTKVETFAINDLQAAPYNPRTITDVALAGLTTSLEQFGLLALPVVNRRPDGTLRLVGGHQRLRSLREKGATTVPCIVVEFDDAQEQKANLALNNEAIQGTFVPQLARALLHELAQVTGDGFTRTFSSLRLDTLLKQVIRDAKSTPGVDDVVLSGKVADDAIPSLSKSTAISKANTLYRCGEHLLYCGRVVKPGTLQVFGVDEVDVAFSRFFSETPYKADYLDAQLGHILRNTTGGIYLAASSEVFTQVQGAFVGLGAHWSNTLLCYDSATKRALPIVYGWRANGMRLFFGDRTQSNVTKLMSATPNGDVPVEVVTRLLLNSVKKGGTVLDVCADAGTTLIAAQKTGRRLIGYVPSPREMDRARARWTQFVHGADADWRTQTEVADVG